MIFSEISKLKLTTFFIKINDIRIFVRGKFPGQKDKKVKSCHIFSVIVRQLVLEKIKESTCSYFQNEFECRT